MTKPRDPPSAPENRSPVAEHWTSKAWFSCASLAWVIFAVFFFVPGAGIMLLISFAIIPFALAFAAVGLSNCGTPFAWIALCLSAAPLAIVGLLFVLLALQTM